MFVRQQLLCWKLTNLFDNYYNGGKRIYDDKAKSISNEIRSSNTELLIFVEETDFMKTISIVNIDSESITNILNNRTHLMLLAKFTPTMLNSNFLFV